MGLLSGYYIVYNALLLSYLWFRYGSVIVSQPRNHDIKPLNRKLTVIIPFYNETLYILLKTLKSVHEANGNKQVFVVNDGSEAVEPTISKYCKKYGFHYLSYKNNKGKRHAQKLAFDKATGDIIVTIDSDTVIEKDALMRICEPFYDEKIGAVTGLTKVQNEKENFLTRCISARYRNAFNFERKSQSTYGVLNCCCGSFSAYRKVLVDEIKEDYVNQMFLGRKCTFGDVRHLTNLILKKGYVVVLEDNAVAYTYVPNKFSWFLKQQLRWSQSFIRENLISFRYMFKRSWALSYDVSVSSVMPLFSLLSRIVIITSIFIEPTLFVYYFVVIGFISVMMNLLNSQKEDYFYNCIYGFIHFLFVYWLYFIALWKVFAQRNVSWGTR